MVHIENLNFSYGKRKALFDQLSLVLPSGNIYGLLGMNGAGKSSLLKIIAGLIFPDNGKVEVAGFIPKDRYPDFLSEVYLVSEEFELPGLTINHYVPLYSPFYSRFNHLMFESYINEFKIRRDQKLTSMSYGQKKKFMLAFGLATDCKLLILDEPTNGLDVPSKSQFRKILANAIHEDRSIIISTHQIRDMENLIDPIIILDEGEIIFFQSCEHVANKLCITKQSEVLGSQHVLYYEPTLGGYTVVKENVDGLDTKINLEILFNAVINNKEKIAQIFNQQN